MQLKRSCGSAQNEKTTFKNGSHAAPKPNSAKILIIFVENVFKIMFEKIAYIRGAIYGEGEK